MERLKQIFLHGQNQLILVKANPGEGSSDYWHVNFTHQRNVNKDFYPYTSWAAEIGNTGGNEPFSIMPPYLSIYIWKRMG